MNKINISELLDHAKFTRSHFFILMMCTLCMIIDGFDVQAISFVAPTLIQQWGVDKQAFGAVFGAGLFGMAIGALTLAPLADRFGRKPILMLAMLILSISMFATMYATSIEYLIVVRFIAGFSLGAIVPNAVSLAGEFSPIKVRITAMMLISSGFILGGVLGGIFASYLIPHFGWQSVFLLGAIAPLIMMLWMWWKLPESLLFLTVKQSKAHRIGLWLQRLKLEMNVPDCAEFPYTTHQQQQNASSLAQIFKNGLAVGTLLLWVVLFMNLLATFFLANWLPILMAQAGYSAQHAVWAGATFWFGGLIGNLVLGRLIDRYGFGLCLSFTFLVAIGCLYSIGQSMHVLDQVFWGIGCAGFCILGAQTALNALAAVYYPTECRSTGAGWALGIGRLGSIFGPIIGGILIAMGLSMPQLFISFSIPLILAAIAIGVFWKIGLLPKQHKA